MTDKIVVFSTCETPEEASRIARALVEAKLAACVNIVSGVESIYRWKGGIESSAEVMLVVKTRRHLFARVQALIESTHSYELPECIAVPVVEGSERYLRWLDEGLS